MTEQTSEVDETVADDTNDGVKSDIQDVDFTYVNHVDPQRQRDPNGVYLDDVERKRAEIQRAKVEGREPDLENPPAITSTSLQPTSTVRANAAPGFVVPVSVTLPVDVASEDTSSGTDVNPAVSPIADEDSRQTVADSSNGTFVADETKDDASGFSAVAPPLPPTE